MASDDYRLDVYNGGHNCEFCGWENNNLVAEIYFNNKLIWTSNGCYNDFDENTIQEFRCEILQKLDELGIERDLSSNYPLDWSDE